MATSAEIRRIVTLIIKFSFFNRIGILSYIHCRMYRLVRGHISNKWSAPSPDHLSGRMHHCCWTKEREKRANHGEGINEFKALCAFVSVLLCLFVCFCFCFFFLRWLALSSLLPSESFPSHICLLLDPTAAHTPHTKTKTQTHPHAFHTYCRRPICIPVVVSLFLYFFLFFFPAYKINKHTQTSTHPMYIHHHTTRTMPASLLWRTS